tara:strand:- start:245 stop:379 length:135 start_codon:yes stop_codon:yes gene_type:complete
MTRQREDEIMGWGIVVMAILTIIAIANATPTPETEKCECTEERR